MERDIKPTYDELESYVENLQKQLADAQATIAALQAVIRQMGEQAAVLAKDGMAAKAQVAALQAQLATCFKLSGADPDGNEDWRLAPHAVDEVTRLRNDYDELGDETEALRGQLTQRTAEFQRHDGELQQICGQALGYPWFKDDQKNFPGATEKDGVCVGEHVGITIAQELANAYRKRTAELGAAKHCYADLLAKYQNLVAWYDKQNGTPCEQVRHRQEVEALQAQVQELEAIKIPDDAFTYCAYCGEKSPVDEHNEDLSAHIKVCPKHPMRDVEAQLTQRTAELKAAKRERDHAKKMEVVQKEVADNQTWHVQQLRAELERVRAERDRLALCGHDHSTQWWQVRYEDLASLVAALPKEPYSLEFARHTSFYEPLQALTQHRQGMEG